MTFPDTILSLKSPKSKSFPDTKTILRFALEIIDWAFGSATMFSILRGYSTEEKSIDIFPDLPFRQFSEGLYSITNEELRITNSWFSAHCPLPTAHCQLSYPHTLIPKREGPGVG